MLVIHSYGLAVFLAFITMLCWGSWGNTQKMAEKSWSFQLFYWDYAIGVLLLALILAFTAGSIGTEGRSFLEDLAQADFRSIGLAFLGGTVFNIANILLVAAIAIAGMAVAFPVGIGLALVIGVVSNYMATPLGNPVLLFAGVALVTVAIVLDAMAYRKLPSSSSGNSTKGIIISLVAGFLMGFFYRFVAASMTADFVTPEANKLTPYTASVIFAVGLLVSNFLWNTIFMYKPLVGEKVTYKDYIKKGNAKLHMVGILGGAIWSLGMTLNIIAAEQAGYAISYGLGQGATLVAALWGVFIWKEFKGAKNVKGLLTAMFAFFVVGLSLIIVARLY
ncbi:glucose uptake protein [Mariniphaga anaerophila]|uniref:Glucose uptake protein n=1 Tax=Mariniphaga anaerophila TaxID=1484053 RepID=A0A1M5FDX0_9BACT|nr:GRP family sugar transporter [Mariniphaga anaerophila]SHF89322.1 glucose uptake protein [Mariniphaga anaerophila]